MSIIDTVVAGVIALAYIALASVAAYTIWDDPWFAFGTFIALLAIGPRLAAAALDRWAS